MTSAQLRALGEVRVDGDDEVEAARELGGLVHVADVLLEHIAAEDAGAHLGVTLAGIVQRHLQRAGRHVLGKLPGAQRAAWPL